MKKDIRNSLQLRLFISVALLVLCALTVLAGGFLISFRLELGDQFWPFFLQTVVVIVILWLLAVIGSFFLIRGVFRPIVQCRSHFEEIKSDQLDAIVIPNLPMELAPFVDRMNVVLESMREIVDRERRFTSDVAHELRTPVAELQSISDVGLRWPDDREMTKTFFKDVNDVATQMTKIVNTLLYLSRCDQNTKKSHPQVLSMNSVIQNAWQCSSEKAKSRQTILKNRIPKSLMISADKTMVERIFQNLINNAITYSPRGSTVVCASEMVDSKLCIVVSNPVENLEPEDLPKMFDRFWRKEAARSQRSNQGLGLSLVEAFSQILEFELSNRLDEEGVYSVMIALPESCLVSGLPVPCTD